MPVPIVAVAAFCFTSAVCSEKKRGASGGGFFKSDGCGFFIEDAPLQKFTVGEIPMSQFIQSSLQAIPCVTSVSVKNGNGRIAVDVTVDNFEWESLEPIYDTEIDLSRTFRGQKLDFRVIDESHAREAAHVG